MNKSTEHDFYSIACFVLLKLIESATNFQTTKSQTNCMLASRKASLHRHESRQRSEKM